MPRLRAYSVAPLKRPQPGGVRQFLSQVPIGIRSSSFPIVDADNATSLIDSTEKEHYRPAVRDDLENPIRSDRMFKASLFAGLLSSRSFSSPSSRAASTGL